MCCLFVFFFQAEDGIRDAQESRGLGDVYKRQVLVEGDLGMELDVFSALVPEEVDLIYHISHLQERSSNPNRGLTAAGFQPESGEEHKQLNREAMANVVHAAKCRGVRRVVYCSSWSAYGRQPDGTNVTEETPSQAHLSIDPTCCCHCVTPPSPVPYFESKLELEEQLSCGCLLYTSDAADEEDSVDLGGRRIIKKKKEQKKNQR
eukprot:TRINITY_DN56009_c0_g2_i3.p1 TRINITY_DN56009_c0_g2~~TRINITY_DN56009_c0_g2_i3.p1  ORF type:complete len:205 (+),score=53.47 TRINITY_DN56009_c0_g2_i3:77-691(+)